MFCNHWKKEIFTIPNLLSLFRLGLIPVYMGIYLRATTPQAYRLAGGILALSCLTDFADGFIARTFHMTSTLGKFLDPVADKATQLTLILCLSMRHRVLRPVLCLFLLKEFIQVACTLFYLHRGKMLWGALPAGKFSTTILFSSLTMLVILPHPHPLLTHCLALTSFFFLLWAFLGYLWAFFGPHRDDYFQNFTPPQ